MKPARKQRFLEKRTQEVIAEAKEYHQRGQIKGRKRKHKLKARAKIFKEDTCTE